MGGAAVVVTAARHKVSVGRSITRVVVDDEECKATVADGMPAPAADFKLSLFRAAPPSRTRHSRPCLAGRRPALGPSSRSWWRFPASSPSPHSALHHAGPSGSGSASDASKCLGKLVVPPRLTGRWLIFACTPRKTPRRTRRTLAHPRHRGSRRPSTNGVRVAARGHDPQRFLAVRADAVGSGVTRFGNSHTRQAPFSHCSFDRSSKPTSRSPGDATVQASPSSCWRTAAQAARRLADTSAPNSGSSSKRDTSAPVATPAITQAARCPPRLDG